MTATTIIRKAQLHEKTVLTDLCLRSKQSNGYDDAFMSACVEELSVQDSWFQEDDFWVAETVDGKLAGCIRLVMGSSNDEGELATLFVDPDAHGKGIGRLLYETLLATARELSLDRIGLDADPEAEPFYERMGFRTIGRSPSGSIPGRTLPRMEISLALDEQSS